ncbi:MAG: hypothetical protein AAFS07_14765 [Pseudomonadota bacterium]
MNDPFLNRATSVTGPGIDYVPVTPDDLTDMATVAVALYAEGAGSVTFISQKGVQRSVQVPNYGYLLCGVRRVLATGTTATGLHAIVVS